MSDRLKDTHPDDRRKLAARIRANEREADDIKADIVRSEVKADVAAGKDTPSEVGKT